MTKRDKLPIGELGADADRSARLRWVCETARQCAEHYADWLRDPPREAVYSMTREPNTRLISEIDRLRIHGPSRRLRGLEARAKKGVLVCKVVENPADVEAAREQVRGVVGKLYAEADGAGLDVLNYLDVKTAEEAERNPGAASKSWQRMAAEAHGAWLTIQHAARVKAALPEAPAGATSTTKGKRRKRDVRIIAEVAAKAYLKANPDATAREVAPEAGCSIGTVSSLDAWKKRPKRKAAPKKTMQLSARDRDELPDKRQKTPAKLAELAELIKTQEADRRADLRSAKRPTRPEND
jgi:hypothetical protein